MLITVSTLSVVEKVALNLLSLMSALGFLLSINLHQLVSLSRILPRFTADKTTPDVTSPDVTTPDVTRPDVTRPDVRSGTVSPKS